MNAFLALEADQPVISAADLAAAVSAALDGFGAAIFLVDLTSRIIHANANGWTLLSAAAVVRECAGRLSAVDPVGDRYLRQLLSAFHDGERAPRTQGSAAPLRLRGGAGLWLAHVTAPIRGRMSWPRSESFGTVRSDVPRPATIARLDASPAAQNGLSNLFRGWGRLACASGWAQSSFNNVEVTLNLRSLFALAAGLLAFTGSTSSPALSFELAGPVVRDNLAVYFIRGNGTGAAAPLTLEQAAATGAVRINEGPYHPITIENLSNQSIFIPFGTLLVGGLQDQVVAQDTILPPGGRMPLEVFCVDPFRSVTRGGEDPTAFSSTGVLFPSRTARLALLAGGGDNKAVENLRQYGLWWSIETVRSQLTRVLGEALEPPLTITWKNDELREARSATVLKARPSSSRTSLPRALENRKLANTLQPYLDLGAAEVAADDVIGAVFAINGRIEGAEIYQSHELFGRLWPSLLRAYATQALAASDAAAEIPPPVPVVQASLAAAQAAPQRTPDSVVRETDDTIYTEARAADGTWIHRSFVPKLTQAVDTPDAVMAGILQSGEILGQPITALGDLDVVLSQDATSGHWSATISTALLEQSLARWLRPQSEWRDQQGNDSGVPWTLALLPWLVGAFVVALRRGAAALGRGIGRLSRAFAAVVVAAAKPAIAATTVAAIGVLLAVLRLLASGAAEFARLRQVFAARVVRPVGPALRLVPAYARPALRGPAH